MPPVTKHDAVVVGARVAGAATAMLLARAGCDVLVLDRSRYGSSPERFRCWFAWGTSTPRSRYSSACGQAELYLTRASQLILQGLPDRSRSYLARRSPGRVAVVASR